MPAKNKKLTIKYWKSLSKGSKERALKFNINKKVLENDNFVVFRYAYNENE